MTTGYTLQHKIIQAPMAGITTPSFVAACCEAGALGSVGAGYLNGAETQKFIQAVKALTDKPFSVNLFIQEEPRIDIGVLQDARAALQPIYEDLGIPDTQRVVSTEVFEGQIQAILDEGVKIVSFTFGIPSEEVMNRLKNEGVFLIGTATTIDEALAVQAAGFDAVVVQGSEAGGHRGSFTQELVLVSTAELVKTAKEQLIIPIIAAGGIMNKEHADHMFTLGADFVQIGTALMTTYECKASQVHKNAILTSEQESTTLSKAFTGKFARGIKNKFTEELKDAKVAPYPIQHYLTLHIRKESAIQNKPEYLSLWMGENGYLAREASVQDIIDSML
ncbi:MAG: nitronate monooxygenase [Solibacillus sp.]|uniref:NAD(P)H-dependent flavin oxidoreductase n=1 Tax=unclassified Solibacillus TaxID=2637870 RepID=UPI0031018DA1